MTLMIVIGLVATFVVAQGGLGNIPNRFNLNLPNLPNIQPNQQLGNCNYNHQNIELKNIEVWNHYPTTLGRGQIEYSFVLNHGTCIQSMTRNISYLTLANPVTSMQNDLNSHILGSVGSIPSSPIAIATGN